MIAPPDEPGTPTPLRWEVRDAERDDANGITLWLSDPADEPYVLELDAARAAALRELLGEGGDRRG